MKRIIDLIMPLDKMRHFFVGTLLAFVLTMAGVNPFIVVCICGAVGILKETYDYFTPGKQEFLDIVYTIVPSILIGVIV